MERLTTKNKKTLECYRVLNGARADILMIYSNKLVPEDAFTFFENNDLSELVIDTYHDITGEKQMSRIMRGYTSLESVQKPLNIADPEMLLIILFRTKQNED